MGELFVERHWFSRSIFSIIVTAQSVRREMNFAAATSGLLKQAGLNWLRYLEWW